MIIPPVNATLTAMAGATLSSKQAAPGPNPQTEIRRPAKPVEKQEKAGAQNPRYHRAGVDRDKDGKPHADFTV